MNKNMSDYYMETCHRIRKVRKARNLTQQELAEMIHISPVHMSNLENGKKMISLDIFMRLTEALQVSADWLLRVNTPQTTHTQSNELRELLSDCTSKEAEAILQIVKKIKKVFIGHRKEKNM